MIRYWSNALDDVHPLVLDVADDGATSLELGANDSGNKWSTIGRFEHRVDVAKVVALHRAVGTPDFRAIATPHDVLPGMVVRRFIVFPNDAPVGRVTIATEISPPLPAFEAAERLALGLVDETIAHPVHALSLHLRSVSMNQGEREVLVSLHNPGSRPIVVHHPGEWAAHAISMLMTARRTGIPVALLREEHQVLADLEPHAVQPGAGGSPGRLELDPGASITLVLRDRSRWPSGPCDVWVAFEVSLMNDAGNEVLRGTATSNTIVATSSK